MPENVLNKAIALASEAHAGQTDKCGKPYILHPIRVMLRVPENLRVPAVLHDVIEDTPIKEKDLKFVGMKNLSIILALTRHDGERYFDYIRRVKFNRNAVIVKLADLEDNMSPERMIGLEKPWSLMERYAKSYYILSTVDQ